MTDFINCNLHGAKQQGSNPPINLNHVTHINTFPGENSIIFGFSEIHQVKWYFDNMETRDREYKRIAKYLGF